MMMVVVVVLMVMIDISFNRGLRRFNSGRLEEVTVMPNT